MRKLLVGLFASVALALSASFALAQTSVVMSVNNVFNKVASYQATTLVTLATTPTDTVSLEGSATKTIYVKEVVVNCVKTTASYGYVTLMKRTTNSTGGTSNTVSAVARDSSNSSATATFRRWTAVPTTLGTGVSMAQQYMAYPAPGTLAETRPVHYRWGGDVDQHLVIRGTAQSLIVNFDSQVLTGAICAVTISWLEM